MNSSPHGALDRMITRQVIDCDDAGLERARSTHHYELCGGQKLDAAEWRSRRGGMITVTVYKRLKDPPFRRLLDRRLTEPTSNNRVQQTGRHAARLRVG